MKNDKRKSRGSSREDASFPSLPGRMEMPESYASILGEIKERIRSERLRIVMAANSSMVLLNWDIGRMILERQKSEGWGAKVIDRLSADLRESFPEMQGLSPRNLKYMRAFAAAWSDRKIVQEVLAQINLKSKNANCLGDSIEVALLWVSDLIKKLCSSLLHNSLEVLCGYEMMFIDGVSE